MPRGRKPDPELQEFVERCGISARSIATLGGMAKLKAMSPDARAVLINMVKARKAMHATSPDNTYGRRKAPASVTAERAWNDVYARGTDDTQNSRTKAS